MENVIQNIKLEDIVPNNYQNHYSITELDDLINSIRKHGILEPITLRPKGNKYELILGNKRYEVAKIIGLTTVPAIIKNIDDNEAKEYLTINNDTLVLNNLSLSNSNENNLDVINLSKLNEEYERDDFKMNNNQFDNNIAQPNNNFGAVNGPAFGGRFFPSLEDEPTNMNFATNNLSNPVPEMQSNNNFIDLTDLNIGSQNPTLPQANFVEPQPINNMTPNFNNNSFGPIPQTMEPQPFNQIPLNDNNIINLESLKQNPEMGTQPINQGINIDNNFQDVINDFHPNNADVMTNQFGPQPINEPMMMNQNMTNIEPLSNPTFGMPQDIPTPMFEPQPLNNQSFGQPEFISPVSEPMLSNINTMPQNNIPNFTVPTPQEPVELIPQKDIMPVINTLKSVAVNLENFGYTIRITDEELPTSYKITIEVDK